MRIAPSPAHMLDQRACMVYWSQISSCYVSQAGVCADVLMDDRIQRCILMGDDLRVLADMNHCDRRHRRDRFRPR